ncbi:hypothetical protein TBLA_0D05310 [Henningerozyma blattae CBS 6284]|uniref:Transporter n=1 Tax=Henningerozyma blattae (strain ATCC 34711 / CBS 6284 / DSM 70876 / NBRC 10599 / NRRL Y-10934 / UCD 77-7) TaxID=1071380 RepID=I2H3S3_HENB6|nr:hypothetical protein TBLA_0D05310 [Tetrapisispora blattae CBS 6284]CCH61025.1 hypothetical protein TBLA_0D05310 [Tetrapisispora blattae CBS 6284]
MDSTQGFTFSHIAYLVFESVLEVIFISLSGYWAAATGMLPRTAQKSLSRMNVDLFTPCLIFSKLAKSLSLAKIKELIVIPIFFGLTTLISYFSGIIMSKFLKLDKDETNFVTGNSIFGNSNSLPVSLTLSLAYTLPNLTWSDIPNDNRENVASRGLLYLLIFQQFGQMLRWSWGYNSLLRWSGTNLQNMPQSQITLLTEDGRISSENLPSIQDSSNNNGNNNNASDHAFVNSNSTANTINSEIQRYHDHHQPFSDEEADPQLLTVNNTSSTNINRLLTVNSNISTLKSSSSNKSATPDSNVYLLSSHQNELYQANTFMQKIYFSIINLINKVISYLNPPLYSMIFAIVVAAIKPLQEEMFYNGGFLNSTFGAAVTQLGEVSIPMILIVLGSNIYPDSEAFKPTPNHNKMVIGSIIGRMVLPSLFLLPIITIAVKYIQTSILDDPIFLVVGFLLTVSPPAIQLTQITQLNEFFEAEMASILTWSYVVLTLPVSIIVVSSAIYVLQWANPN